ncbi:unnamed protein product [Caenorhabditis auriculariae]|uniref:Uncharacterized protein n=1 Tax=Caenorhabditis auriculariae TaxID=2777116 RepID=A0A8S1GQ17_9PELO|nr:unnamed protein product [Caenorhabditis auriculariae]
MTFSYATTVDRIYKSGVTVVVLREIPSSEVVEVDFGSTKKRMAQIEAKRLLSARERRAVFSYRRRHAGLKGTLAEVNDRLKDNPDLVRTAPENQGYIGVVTYGAGKREPEGFGDELPAKRVFLRDNEPVLTENL